MTQHDKPPQSLLDERLSRRGLFGLCEASLLALALSGDTQSKRPELPVGKYHKVIIAGDSFSEGRGASDQAHSYGPIVASKLQAEECEVIAKTGWTAEEMLKGRGDIPSQIDQIPADADLILATIGGNAIDLRRLGTSCISDGCGIGTNAYNEAAEMFRSDKYFTDLKAVYRAMLDKAPNADIMIVGYPLPVVSYALPKKIEEKLAGFGIPELTALGKANDEGLESLIRMLNAATQAAIRDIGDPRLIYVAPPPHIDVITTKILRQPADFNLDMDKNSSDAGHPNDLGYEAMAKTVLDAITAAYNKKSKQTSSMFAGRAAGK